MTKRARQSCNLISGTVQGYYAAADGSINSTDTHWCRSDLISCEGGTSYVCTVTIAKTSRWVAAAFYDVDMNYLGSIDTKPNPPIANVTLSFTTPATAAYMGLSFAATYYYITLTPSEITNLMLNEGSTALPYEPYGIVGFYDNCAVKSYHKSANLLDMSAVTANSLLNRDTGTVIPASSLYAVTDFIPVEEGSYSYSLNDYGGYFSGVNVVFYSAQKEYITGEWIRWAGDPEKSMTIEVPAGVAYMRVETITDPPPEDAQQMINRGAQKPYEPYSGEAWHDVDDCIRQNGVWVQQ